MINKRDIVFSGVIILLLILTIGLMLHLGNIKRNVTSLSSINTALSNGLVKFRDKTHSEIAQKSLILANYKTLQSIHASDSSEIGRLQQIVKKGTIAATILKNNTHGTLTGTTNVTFGNKHDSVPKITYPCDSIPMPQYQAHLEDSTYNETTKKYVVWGKMDVIATNDSTHVNYTINNEFDITHEIKKEGFWPFRKRTPIVQVKSLNPHTETNQIMSYAVPPSPKPVGAIAAGTTAAALIGFILGVVLTR